VDVSLDIFKCEGLSNNNNIKLLKVSAGRRQNKWELESMGVRVCVRVERERERE
jgi:hypothetical protein